jgi:hypothetical protein
MEAALTNSGLPSILVATKCEHPEEDWEVDAEAMAKHKYFQACIATYKVSTETPELARACLQAILRAAVAHRRGTVTPTPFENPQLADIVLSQRRMARPSREGERSRISRPKSRTAFGL